MSKNDWRNIFKRRRVFRKSLEIQLNEVFSRKNEYFIRKYNLIILLENRTQTLSHILITKQSQLEKINKKIGKIYSHKHRSLGHLAPYTIHWSWQYSSPPGTSAISPIAVHCSLKTYTMLSNKRRKNQLTQNHSTNYSERTYGQLQKSLGQTEGKLTQFAWHHLSIPGIIWYLLLAVHTWELFSKFDRILKLNEISKYSYRYRYPPDYCRIG